MPKTRDGVEVDRKTGKVWAVHGLLWPHSLIDLDVEHLEDDDIAEFYSCKAAAIDAAEAKIRERKAEAERRHENAMAEVAGRMDWIARMRADLAKPAALAGGD